MKLLLDENLPVKLKDFFSDIHEVETVQGRGWNGVKNGKLFQLLTSAGFDALVTIDKNLRHQQRIDDLNVIIIILNAKTNRLSSLKPFVAKLEEIIKIPPLEKVIIVEV